MAQYRGVFIAPPTINQRAHRRSKTYPPKTSQYKSEHSYFPEGRSNSSLCPERAPSLPCLFKEVTLKFIPDSRKKRQTSNFDLSYSFPEKLRKDPFEKDTNSDPSKKTQDEIEKTPNQTGIVCQNFREKSKGNTKQLIKEQIPVESVQETHRYLSSSDRVKDPVDSAVCCERKYVASGKGRLALVTQEDFTIRTESGTQVSESSEKTVLTFGKTVYPHGLELKYKNDTEQEGRRNKDAKSDSEIDISLQEQNYFPEVSDHQIVYEQKLKNRASLGNKEDNLDQLVAHCNSFEKQQTGDFEAKEETDSGLKPLRRSLRQEPDSLKSHLITEVELQEDTSLVIEAECKEQFEKTNDEISYEIKRKLHSQTVNNSRYQKEAKTQEKSDTIQELFEQHIVIPLESTVILKNDCFSKKKQEADQNIDEKSNIVEEARPHRTPIVRSIENNLPVENFNEIQHIQSPTAYKGPIVFHFEAQKAPQINKEQLEVSKSEENSEAHAQKTSEGNPGNVSPRCNLFPNLLEYSEGTFNEKLPDFTSTPKPSKYQAVKEQNSLDCQDISCELVEETPANFCESENMASLTGKNVKVNKELWESRETVRKLEEKLLKEQKNSESKERTIKSLQKEVIQMKEQVSADTSNNENVEHLKSKLLSIETDNRILIDQVKMVEDANKNLYKELYETKTQLRFQERHSDDVGAQNAQTGKRLSHVLQSSMDKSTLFTVFLHQIETNVLSLESALKKLKARRQALEDVLKEEEKPEVGTTKFSFLPKEKMSFFTEEVKRKIRSSFEKSLEMDFTNAESKRLYCDERIEDLENILNDCMESRFKVDKEKASVHQKKIDLARVHVRALKDIEGKCVDSKKRTEQQIATMKGRISNEVKEISKEISAIYLAKQERKSKARKKMSNIESPEAIRKKSVEEIANIDRVIRSLKSRSSSTHDDLSENEKEILTLNKKMSQSLNDKIQLSEELLDTQSKIQELENRYEDKQQETQRLEMEMSTKRQQIAEMAKEMQNALRNISLENVSDITDKQPENDNLPKESQKVTAIQKEDKEVQIDEMKDELVQTMMLLETEQKERQEALRMNEDLFLELENREQEISNLVVELEQLKDEKKSEENRPETWTRLNELLNSVELNKSNEELLQLKREIEEEVKAKEKEFGKFKNEFDKQSEELEKLEMLLDYYKDEMSKLQQDRRGSPSLVREQPIMSDSGAHNRASNEESPVVANLEIQTTKRDEIIRNLENDVSKLQKALAAEIDFNKSNKENVLSIEEALHKEKRAKEYAYKRNKELEEEVRIKDAKLKNFSNAVEMKKQEVPLELAEETRLNSNMTTLADLRATMAQIQNEKEDLETEVDDLASALEENNDTDILHSTMMQKTEAADLYSVRNDFFDQLDGTVPKASEEDEETYIRGIQQQKGIDKKDEKANKISLPEKDKIVEELQQTINTLKKEVEQLQSENTLLENEAVDVLDDGIKVENKILRNQVNSLTNELAIARADEDDMKREFEHVENRTKELQGALLNVTSSKTELEYSNEDLIFQNKILHQELDLLKKKNDVLEEERKIITGEAIEIDVVDSKAYLQENENLKTEIAKITLEMKVDKEEVERLQGELAISEDNVKDLETKLSSLQKEKDSLKILADDLSFQNKTQEKEMNLLNKKIVILEEEIKVIEQDLTQRSDEVKEKEDAIQTLLKGNASKEDEKQKLKQKETAFQSSKIAEERQLKHLAERNFDLEAQLNKFKMDSKKSKQEQLKLEQDLNELRGRLREADRKFNATRDEKMTTEDNLSSLKSRVGQLQKDLSGAKNEIREKNEVIRKLNLKNSELEIGLAEREEELRREEKLRMDNMKTLDALKIKMEKMETDEKKQKDRLFGLKSACSEANEAYEIVKKQNLTLRNDMQALKKKFEERNTENENNKREKEKLEEQILNVSRTIDDIRKYSSRDESLSPDSALGISVSSLTELGSGPNSPNSDISENLFSSNEDEFKFMPQEQQGLLCKMPTMVENFRAVVRDNEMMKSKVVEMMNNKDKMSSQLQHYSALSDDLQKEVGEKEKFVNELQTKTRLLEDELSTTKNSLNKVERNYAVKTSEADRIKTTLKVREDAVAELREKVELLEEKEKALELYSKSLSEKYLHQVEQKKDVDSENQILNEKNNKQKILLKNLEKKLSEYSSRPRRVSEPEVKPIALPIVEQIPKKKSSEVAMATLEGKLDSIVEYSDVLESSLTEIEMGYRNLQIENERLQREMVSREEHESLQTDLKQQESSFREQEQTFQEKIDNLQAQNIHLENQMAKKSETLHSMTNKERELLQECQKLKGSFVPLEEANSILKGDIENLKEDAKHAEETRVKLETDLKLATTKMCEMEITTEAYKEENERLRNDVIALSEEKCQQECKVSEAERREKKLNDIANRERVEHEELKAEHETSLSMYDSMQGDLTKAKDKINKLESELGKTQQGKADMEAKLNELSSQKDNLRNELQLAGKDNKELEDRYKKSVDEEELLNEKLNKLALENSRLKTAFDQSQKRKTDAERELIESKSKNEDYEAQLEEIRIEKAGLLKEIAKKEETTEGMEAKKSDLELEKQKLTNDLYLSTKKVLSLQLNLESLRNEVTELGKEIRRLVLGAVGREIRDEAEEKSMEADLEMSLFENEVVVQALKQTIKTTERCLDLIKPEANISEVENKLCQKDIDSVHREFAFLKDQLSSFRHSCQKLSDESKKLKDDLYTKNAILQDTKEQYEAVQEENIENKENVLQLQSKCKEFESLTAEYEENVETAHNDIVRANQTIATLEANLAKMEQKKNSLEKEKLVMQERLNNLEALQRATKDEVRSDKKRIASLEVESNEKHGLARELEKVESNLSELRLKYEDALKTKQEIKEELETAREELRQEEMELKNTKKDSENFKKHIVIEREMRERVEQDLNEHVEELKSCKKNLHTLQRANSKLQDENETLVEKAKLLEETGLTFKKQLEVQAVEMKRLRETLAESKKELLNSIEKYEGNEKERKRLIEDLVHSEEQIKKLQDTCNELLKEKGFATDKVSNLSDTLDAMISGHEDTINSLKQELMGTNKDLSVTKSALERGQKRNEELLQQIKIQEDKIKAIDEKKQELFDKFWESQNQLSEAQSRIDSLTTETKDVKGRLAIYSSKIEHLEDALQKMHEESESTIGSLNERVSTLKSQGNELSQKRDMLQNNLQQTEDTLSRTSEELNHTAKTLADKEHEFVSEIGQRDYLIEDLKRQSEEQRGELKKTKETLKDVRRENVVLKEKLEATEKTLEHVEGKVNEHENNHDDALAEAHAKLKVVSKLKASKSGENFAELQSAPLLEADQFDFFDSVDAPPKSTSIKDVVDAFHQTCMSSFGDNRDLQDKLANANEDNKMLEESLNKERSTLAETKRYLQESEKKKNKLEEEVRRLRRRLETFKQKSIEMEKSKDDALCDVKAEKMNLDKENWALKEEVEELKAKSKETEEERDRYEEDLNTTQKQVVEAREDIQQAQEQLDGMQEQLLEMKKRTFELEAREKSLQQQIKDKEKELCASQMKADELAKLYDNANQKKTELFTKVSKAEDKIRNQETEREENEINNKEMEKEIETLKCNLSELQQNLEDITKEEQDAKDKIEELEIQRGSLQASNEILKHQLELSNSEKEALKDSYDNTHDESLNLSRALNEVTINKDNLETDLKCLSQEKERLQEALNASENQLRKSEDNLVKAFQESENLKRQMLKVQSTACAESVKHQGDFAKMKSELESTKKDAMDKDKDYNEQFLKLKIAEKEIDNLKRELNDIHMRESELKLDYTTANSKLQSYVLERECWEREVKTVLGEIEQQKNNNATKEHLLERLRMRYEQEIGFLSQRVSALERELKIVQDASEQQRHADEIAHKLNVEAKDMEIDNLRMRLQATRMHSSDKNTVVDQMKNQIDERTSQIGDLMNQMSILKDSYKLELASVQADLKCSQMENLLKLKKDMGTDNQLGASQTDSVSDLLDAIKDSRKESERLRHLLGSRMREMNNLKKDIISKRANSPGSRSYGLYNE